MAHNRHGRHYSRLTTWKRRLRRWYMIGSLIVGALYAIDQDWPLHFRRLVLAVAIWIRSLPGSYRR